VLPQRTCSLDGRLRIVNSIAQVWRGDTTLDALARQEETGGRTSQFSMTEVGTTTRWGPQTPLQAECRH
jgi:hypothetical protein